MDKADELAKKLWDYHLLHQPLEKADLIFVLGSRDLRVAEYAAELFLARYAPLVVFSGAFGKVSAQFFPKPEAEMFAETATKLGVPADKIIVENQSTNTGENILFTKHLLEEKGINVKKLIALQKPYMERRTYATIKKQWPEVELIVSSPPISYEDYPNEVITKDNLINGLTGDLVRLKIYADKGFQIPQEIPEDVWSAYEALVKLGYNRRLVGN